MAFCPCDSTTDDARCLTSNLILHMRYRHAAFPLGRTTALRDASCIFPFCSSSACLRGLSLADPRPASSTTHNAEDARPGGNFGSALSAGASKRKRDDLANKVSDVDRKPSLVIDH